MDKNYFESLKDSVQEPEKADYEVESLGTAFLTVKVDIDCKLYCDGDFLDLFEANKVKKVQISTGQHLMTVESESFEDISEDYVIDAADVGKNYLLLVNNLKQRETEIREEQARKEEELLRQKKEQEERERILRESEPYAAFSKDGKTLTFYFDTQKAVRKGLDIHQRHELGLPGFCVAIVPIWVDDETYKQITQVVFDESFAFYDKISDLSNFFSLLLNLKKIQGLDFFKTKNVTNMEGMFRDCSSLESLDLSNFNTENVTDMSHMFHGCSSLESLDLSNFNTENVEHMSDMFALCSSLVSLDLSNFNTENVTNMWHMFYGCSSLVSLDLSNFNTENVTDMDAMFQNCSSLHSIKGPFVI